MESVLEEEAGRTKYEIEAEEHKYPDPFAKEYREAVYKAVEAQRDERYAHLPPGWFRRLATLLATFSAALWIDGSPPGVLLTHVFDLTVREGARVPPAAQATRLGPGDQRKEWHHLEREMKLGHYVPATADEPGETASRVHVVPKPGEEKIPEEERMGRLVCDYRKVCEITECEPGVQTNGDKMTMWMASSLWKSLCDLLLGVQPHRPHASGGSAPANRYLAGGAQAYGTPFWDPRRAYGVSGVRE